MKMSSLFIVLLVIVSCNKSDDVTNNLGLIENLTIDVTGINRNYHLYIPENSNNSPVVFLFHGNRSSNDGLLGLNGAKAPYKQWLNIAQQENIILVIPDGTNGSNGHKGWNDCRSDATGNPNVDDVLFIDNLIDFVVDQYLGNASKVFAVGTSNGGHMAMRLAQEIPNKLKAFAAIVAANPVNIQCTNSTIPISALFMNGTEDPILPFEGGFMPDERGEVFSSQETIDYWVSRNGTDVIPIETDIADINTTDNCTVKKYVYKNGTNNTEVAFYKVIGGGHTEPSIAERYSSLFLAIVEQQNGDIEMANEVWDFFKNQ